MEKGGVKGEDGSGKVGRRDGKETNEVGWMEYLEMEEELNRRGQRGGTTGGRIERGCRKRRGACRRTEDQRRGYHLHEVRFQNVIEIFSIILFTVHPVGDHDINMML